MSIVRAIVLWIPDWPILAAQQEGTIPAGIASALIERGRVFACSARARDEGVRRGLSVREAQLRCPELAIGAYDPFTDTRVFETVAAAIEEIVPGVHILRPGLCALRARGPERYYGGEEPAAAALLTTLARQGTPGRIGLADSVFAAERAARGGTTRRQPVRIIERGGSRSFLSPQPITVLDDAALVPVFKRLGLHTLGDLAALHEDEVVTRFGEQGRRAHARASGSDDSQVMARVPPPHLEATMEFEPALDRVDQVAFAFRAAADGILARLVRAHLVCTEIRITVDDEAGGRSERQWSHPRHFTAAEIIDRVRWQLQGQGASSSGLASPLVRIRVSPESVDAISHHEVGLWGAGDDDRVHHGLPRLQGSLGHDSVLTAVVEGGRFLADRRTLVPWGEAPPALISPAAPWPGRLPDPAPATVFASEQPATVLDNQGAPLDIDERGELTGAPAWFSAVTLQSGAQLRAVSSWAGPWPVTERWWDAERTRRGSRLQLVDARGDAWLVTLENHAWYAEAHYD